MIPIQVVVDCDPGNGVPGANVDDAVALTYLLGQPKFIVRAVWTVAGNTPAAVGQAAARRLFTSMPGITSPPVRCGAAVEDLLGVGGPVTLLALGPLTNLASLLTRRPEAFTGVERIVLMGGCLGYGDLVDTNLALDPAAARVVFGASSPTVPSPAVPPLTVVPLDVTRTTHLSPARWADIAARVADPSLAAALRAWLEPWLAYSAAHRPVDGMWLHDLVVPVLLADPGVVTRERATVTVSDDGKLRRCATGTAVDLVTAVDNDRLVDAFDAAVMRLSRQIRILS